jgi:hypothetical protein
MPQYCAIAAVAESIRPALPVLPQLIACRNFSVPGGLPDFLNSFILQAQHGA